MIPVSILCALIAEWIYNVELQNFYEILQLIILLCRDRKVMFGTTDVIILDLVNI